MIEKSERPLTELRIPKSAKSKEYLNWINSVTYSQGSYNDDEFVLLLPHPKHKGLGGLDINEFLEDCPRELAFEIKEIYNSRIKARNERHSMNVTGFNLEDDFGFILVAFM